MVLVLLMLFTPFIIRPVSAPGSPPMANDDAYATDEDTPLSVTGGGVLDNDADIDADPLTAVLVSGPANGMLTLNTDGSFTYTPNPDFSGTDSFTYKAYDGSLDSNIATVTITVNPVPDGIPEFPIGLALEMALFAVVAYLGLKKLAVKRLK